MSNPNAISIEVPTAGSSSAPQKLSRRAQRTANRGKAPTATNPATEGDFEGGGGPGEGGEGGEKKKKKFHHRVTPEEREDKAEKEVGVSKLKASLRQAKRFLAKEGLSADVKIEQERKIKSLEADIEKALARNAEKKNAEKYHMVKFFERQKLLRQLKPLLKSLAAPQEDSAARQALEKEVLDLRVGLNYVLNYPNAQKYISLFPPTSTPQTAELDGAEDDVGSKRVKPILRKSKPGADKTDEGRSRLVEKIRGLMEDGSLSAKPEIDLLAASDPSDKKRKRGLLDESSNSKKSSSKKGGDTAAAAAAGLEGDDFFGGDESD